MVVCPTTAPSGDCPVTVRQPYVTRRRDLHFPDPSSAEKNKLEDQRDIYFMALRCISVDIRLGKDARGDYIEFILQLIDR